MKIQIMAMLVCAMMTVSSLAMVDGAEQSIDAPIENSGERALGGLINPNGFREGPTTRLISPEELLQELPGEIPAAVDNSAGFPPVGNQQSQASCSAWAIGYYHATYIENQETPMDLTDPNNQVSPAYLYNLADAGYNYGSDMNDVADLIISNGACSMAEMPYDTSDYTSWPDEDWIWVSGMKRKAVSKTWLQITQKPGMDALKAYLAAGNSAVTHIQVYSNFDYIGDFNNVYSSAEKYGTDRGGHAVAICGYDDTFPTADGPGALRMVNSWGTGWGDAGYWWLSYSAIKDSTICYGRALYLTSEVNYEPTAVVKANINHPLRGDIVSDFGLTASLIEGGTELASKSFLCCPALEGYLGGYGYAIQQYPFPSGKMAFDVSGFLPLMDPLANHDFRLSLDNKGSAAGNLVTLEAINAERWEGGLSWEAPSTVAPSTISLADAWVTPGVFYHMPIRVDGDLDLGHNAIGEFWEGDGTLAAPYVMPEYIINGTGYGYCIYVGNTTGCFAVQGCNLHEASGNGSYWPYYTNSGLMLNNVQNGIIENNTASLNSFAGIFLYLSKNNTIVDNVVSNNDYGLYLYNESDSNIIANNNITSNNWDGIYMYSCSNTIVNNNIDSNNQYGIELFLSDNNSIANNKASDNDFGIFLRFSFNNTIANNNASSNIVYGIILVESDWNRITNNTVSWTQDYGLVLLSSYFNTITDNTAISNGDSGIWLSGSYYNNILNNTVSLNNNYGIQLSSSSNNNVHHNNILNNMNQAYDDTGTNLWDDGYPSGGNYWSDYAGIDLYSGPGQNIPGSDSIGDTPYVIDPDSQDDYPLMAPWTPQPLAFFNISLSVGWNFISIPLAMSDTSVESVLASISGMWDSVKYYDSADSADPWKSFRPSGTANDLSSIDRTMGVWIHATGSCVLNVSGEMPASTEITLRTGWNLVGYPSETGRTVADALLGTGADRVETFDLSDPELLREMAPEEMMVLGMGYWVHTVSDAVWIINW